MPLVRHEFVVRTVPEWSGLCSAARFEIVEFLRMVAPCSLTELGAAMARSPDSLYHHMRILMKIGLVVRAEDRPLRVGGGGAREGSEGGGGRRRKEAVFDLVSRVIRFDTDDAGRDVRMIQKLAISLARLTTRSVTRALGAGVAVGSGATKQIWARSETAWLDDNGLAAVNEHLLAIDAIFDRGRLVRRGRLFHTGLFLTPAVRQERRSRSSGSSRGGVGQAVLNSSKGRKTWIVPTA